MLHLRLIAVLGIISALLALFIGPSALQLLAYEQVMLKYSDPQNSQQDPEIPVCNSNSQKDPGSMGLNYTTFVSRCRSTTIASACATADLIQLNPLTSASQFRKPSGVQSIAPRPQPSTTQSSISAPQATARGSHTALSPSAASAQISNPSCPKITIYLLHTI